MKCKMLATALMLSAGLLGMAADAPTDLKNLMARVQARLKAGERTEAKLGNELKAFDAYVTKYKTEDPENAAQAAYMRAYLYVQVFGDPAKGAALMTQLQTDFPETKIAKQIPQALATIKKLEAAQQTRVSLQVGGMFPGLSEKDVNGQTLSLAQYKGKVVLVDFWATWCGPCVGELPNVKAAYQKYHKDGFEIVGISLDSDKAQLTGFLARENITWQQYFDGKGWDNKVSTRFGISSIPATFLLDGTGKIIARDLRGDELDAALAKVLKK